MLQQTFNFEKPRTDKSASPARRNIVIEAGAGTGKTTAIVAEVLKIMLENEELSQHRMHNERFVIPESTAQAIETARAANRSIIAVGTTALRALESAAREDGAVTALAGETDLFITPGYRFRVVDRLLTNFHLPRSTLLMLVSAFAGYDAIRAAYAHAIRERYRFFSYGDAMLLEHQADA